MSKRAILCCLALLAGACVSSGRYHLEVERNTDLLARLRTLEQENVRLRADAAAAASRARGALDDLRACEAKLADLDRVQKSELMNEVTGLRERLPEIEEKGYFEGQLRLWESLRIEGLPRQERKILGSNYYYRIVVSLGGHAFFTHEIQTERRESSIGRAFATALTAVELATRLPRMPRPR